MLKAIETTNFSDNVTCSLSFHGVKSFAFNEKAISFV